MARKSNVFMLHANFKTNASFGSFLANSSKIPNEVKSMTFFAIFVNMLTIHRIQPRQHAENSREFSHEYEDSPSK